jgi:hypothetical protein
MADDVTLNTGSVSPAAGTIIAADEIAGVKHQRIKVQHGENGSATDVSAASPLPVESTSAEVTAMSSGAAVAPAATKLWGFTIRNTSDSARAVVRLRDGVVGGEILAAIPLGPGEGTTVSLPVAAEITHADGVWTQVVSGAIEGSVYTS